MYKTYQEVIQFLYQNIPMYQQVGAVAYKKDLTNIIKLCDALHNPQFTFKTVHVGGTNGKGSSSHMLAAIVQTAGYKTGLYTSPHLKEFTERIKVNGIEISANFVVDFINKIKFLIESIKPSFFEITVAMAFDYFAFEKVDIAIIEVGLGGRLDSTNIINPILSLITNISYDHQSLLGDTKPQIAFEKAGIIKQHTPVVISERDDEVDSVFIEKAKQTNSPIFFAEDDWKINFISNNIFSTLYKQNYVEYRLDLTGIYQQKNLAGVLQSVELLNKNNHFVITSSHIEKALTQVCKITGLKGRWQKLNNQPLTICDTGHNIGGIRLVLQQIAMQSFSKLYFVLGFVKDKNIQNILSILPQEAYYIFCQAKIPRSLDAQELQRQAELVHLKGEVVPDVNDAIRVAQSKANAADFIFIGGSTFVVAEIHRI